MSTLYELSANYEFLVRNAAEIDEELLKDTLESIDEDIELKADNYARVLVELDGQINTLKAEEKRLADKRKAIENNVKRMKQSLEESMRLTGKTKFKTDFFSFNIQKNPVSVKVIDESLIDENYFVEQPKKLDKQQLKEDLKMGANILGAELIQTEGLRIR